MKTLILLVLLTVWNGILLAEPPEKPQGDPKPEPALGEAKVEKPIEMEKRVTPENAWTKANYGVVGQFLNAPSLWAPINPMAEPEAGFGKGNLSQDTVTGRVMGLRLIKFEF